MNTILNALTNYIIDLPLQKNSPSLEEIFYIKEPCFDR